MVYERAKEIMQIEQECVKRQGTMACPNRDCANCDLLLPTSEVLKAYEIAIECITNCMNIPSNVTHMFKPIRDLTDTLHSVE